jgi:SAM-dependent methyltransferase
MDSDTKRSEIETYDGEDDSRPEYGSLWDHDHQEKLLQYGPEGEFQELLESYAESGDILVLGCGKGGVAHRLAIQNPDREVCGIELSGTQVQTAAKNSPMNSEFLRSDAEQLPFSSDSFDVVVAHSILHHLPAWDSVALDEITRVLTETGVLLFYEPGRYNPPAALRRKFLPSQIHTPDEQPFNPNELRTNLSSRFNKVSITGHCVFSNTVPVFDNQFPIDIPHRLTIGLYQMEQWLMEHTSNRFAWILTGIAKNPT